jgi:peptide/nickel transport system permease protein
MTAVVDTATPVTEAVGRNRAPGLRAMLRQPVSVAALVFLALLSLAVVFADRIAPYGPGEQDLTVVLSGPTADHLLGTDTVGRDVLSRLLYGGRTTLVGALEAVAVYVAIGVPLGILTGYLGGWADRVAMRVVELVLSIPAIIMILVVLAVFPGNAHAAMLALGVLGSPGLVRILRSATLAVREELFIASARVSGLTPLRIMRTHILRRVAGPLLVQVSLFAGIALIFESSLGFLGLSADPSDTSWGGMVGEASTVLGRQAWLLFPSGAVIALTVLSFGLLGDAIRDRYSDGSGAGSAARRVRPVRASASAPAPATDVLLAVRDLSIAFGDTTVVDGVTFDVHAGETVGLVGESGCGKSVTALAALGLLPENGQVTGGAVMFDGVDLAAGGARAYRAVRGRGMAFISQDPLGSLDPTHTVGNHLAEVVRLHDRIRGRAVRARVTELLAQVNLPQPHRVARLHPHELSGGMAQRVAIAIALAGRPRLLVADEPTTALDVTVQAEILRLLRRLQHETHMAVLLISHDWGVVADLCARAVVMYAGQVVEQAGVDPLFDAPLHPYTRALQAANPAAAEPGRPLPALPGQVPNPQSWPRGCRFAPRCGYVTAECREPEVIPLVAVGEAHVSRCVHTNLLGAESRA